LVVELADDLHLAALDQEGVGPDRDCFASSPGSS
jgi:hypothetical protein